MDELFCKLREEFHIKPEDCPIFYLYDRDVLSYQRNELRKKYVKKYTDPYGTESGDQGQLLLSYPAIDEYSCAVTPQVRQTGNRLSGLAGTAYASLLA